MKKNQFFLCFSLFLLFSTTEVKADNLTINNGSTINQFVPIYGYYADRYSRSQFIIPATSLEDLLYGTINGLTFYAQNANINWGNAKFEVYVTEVDYTSFTNTTMVDWVSMNKVMNAATLSIVNNQMVVTFDTPYQYIGGNLLIGIRQTVEGSYCMSKWYGVSATNASLGGYETYRGVRAYSFLPKMTFHYTPGTPPSCIKPTSLDAINVGHHAATLNWESDADSWQICLNGDEQNLIDVTEKPYTLCDLLPETTYVVTMRTDCGDDGYSEWSAPISFTTGIACYAPTNLSYVLSLDNSTIATLNWTENGEASVWQICLNGDEQNLIEVTENPYTLTGLIPETLYTAKVRANCGGINGTSQWSNTVTFEPTEKITIGSGTATINHLPTHSFYNYSFTQQIYTVDELGTACFIERIEFYNTSAECTRNMDIYMVNTDKHSFDGTNDWVAVTEANLVFSGTVRFLQNAWTSIPLNTYYPYDGLHNIVLVVDDNSGYYQSPSMYFRSFAASNQAMYFHSDNINFSLAEPYTGTIASEKNQIRFAKGNPSCVKPYYFNAISVTPYSATFDWVSDASVWQICLEGEEENPIEVTEKPYTLTGLLPETEYTAKIRTVCGDNDYSHWDNCTFTTRSLCEIPSRIDTAELMETQVTLSWEGLQDSYNLRYGVDKAVVTTVDFEDGLIPATWNNNSAYPWTVEYDPQRNTHYIMSSNQGIPSSTSSISFTATYDTNGTIEFDGNCLGEGLLSYWDHCDFYIDNTLLLYAGANIVSWGHYTFDVAAGEHTFTWSYTKDDYINPTGDYFAVDNIVMTYSNYLWEPTIENITETTYHLTGLQPNTTYCAQVQGNQAVCDEGITGWSEMISFTTSSATQTIALATGWNYCSFCINITLDDLKAALTNAVGNTNITIKSQTSNTIYNGVRWMGTLNSLDLSQMYLIKVDCDCEITLEGARINADELPIMISNGFNYIAFPFDETMTISNAFTEFAGNGDKVSSHTGSASYDGTSWRGNLRQLMPGEGYIYKSNVQADRIFIYPAR